MYSVFIDGKEGTTGLRIYERLGRRSDIKLITLSDELRKNSNARREALNSCDIAFLCLPDTAAREAVAMVENPSVRIIDASTAHRTAAGWAYGFPELSEDYRQAIICSKRVAVPGCHASGFIALVQPLVAAGILSSDALLSCTSITGYSGGGKKLIEQYEDSGRSELLDAPRLYALGQAHKHLPEMKAICALKASPIFLPVVSDMYKGMLVSVPLFPQQLSDGYGAEDIRSLYRRLYNGPFVVYKEKMDEDGYMSASALSGTDRMEISVLGNDDRLVLAARFDNLGKGASGAAIECMNIMTGMDPITGLVV
jgi:N-acetyl-gamma-glutamyl-phosphate reductase